MKKGTNKRSGFSLIEVALALLIVGVGLLAVIGIFPGSLDNSRKATDDTQAALFADYVLNSLRAVASGSNAVVRTWTDVSGTAPQITIAAYDRWDQGLTMKVKPGAGVQTLAFKPAAYNTIEEMTLAYDMTISTLSPNVKRAQLKVWINDSKNTNSLHTFYADLYRGDLK